MRPTHTRRVLRLTEETARADVVVIGGGAVGSACAYYLAAAGRSVVLLEQQAVASGASTHATGSLSLLSTDFRSEAYLRLGVDAYREVVELVPALQELTGIDVMLQLRPGLRFALDDEEEAMVKESLAWQSSLVDAWWIDGAEALKLEPRLNPEVRGGAFEPESAQLDSGRLTLALATAAEKRGATIVLRRAVGLTIANGRIAGVRHTHGEISCDSVVIAMGPWSAVAGDWLDMRVPVRPLWGERMLLRLPGPPLGALMFSPKRGHMISRVDGFLSVGSTAGRDFDDMKGYLVDADSLAQEHWRPTPAALEELFERAVEVLPDAIMEASVAEQLAGVRPLSPDRYARIGAVPSCPGAYLATGHGTKGIHLAAYTGRLIRDLIIGTQDRVPDVVDPTRFATAAASDDAVFAVDD
jgi:glycine oxidase